MFLRFRKPLQLPDVALRLPQQGHRIWLSLLALSTLCQHSYNCQYCQQYASPSASIVSTFDIVKWIFYKNFFFKSFDAGCGWMLIACKYSMGLVRMFTPPNIPPPLYINNVQPNHKKKPKAIL